MLFDDEIFCHQITKFLEVGDGFETACPRGRAYPIDAVLEVNVIVGSLLYVG